MYRSLSYEILSIDGIGKLLCRCAGVMAVMTFYARSTMVICENSAASSWRAIGGIHRRHVACARPLSGIGALFLLLYA